MDQRLTQYLIGFFSPLFLKPLRFLILADRAYSLCFSRLLVRPFFIERMPSKASSFLPIKCRNTVAIFNSINTRRNDSQMRYFDTVPIFTDVVDNHSFSDRAVFYVKSNTVCPSCLLTKIKRTIPISIKGFLPQLASIFFHTARIESFYFVFSSIVHATHITPSYSR